VGSLEARKPAAAEAARGPDGFDQLPGQISSVATPSLSDFQAAFVAQTEIGRRIINNPDAPTFYEIKQLAWHVASLWESVAGSAERCETVMLHYQALRI
jgi:hypothetical protein